MTQFIKLHVFVRFFKATSEGKLAQMAFKGFLSCALEHLPQQQQRKLTLGYNTNNPKQNLLVCYFRNISGDTNLTVVPFTAGLSTVTALSTG